MGGQGKSIQNTIRQDCEKASGYDHRLCGLALVGAVKDRAATVYRNTNAGNEVVL